MKEIKYQVRGITKAYNPETHENESRECFVSVVVPWTEDNEEIARKTAHNGVYSVEDNGKMNTAPSQLDIIEAQVAYTAMMTDTLLEV